jgi:hypothetical protein
MDTVCHNREGWNQRLAFKLRHYPYQQCVESPLPLCYRESGFMKTDRQPGSKAQHAGKPTLGLSRAQRGPSAPRPPVPIPFLIANLELEFTSTHRKHNPLRISNRNFLRVFRSDFSNLRRTSSERSNSEPSNSTLLPVRSPLGCLPPATAFLTHGSAIKTPANSQGFNDVRFFNRR